MNKISGINFIYSFPNGYQILEIKPSGNKLLLIVKTPKDVIDFYIMDHKFNVKKVIMDKLPTL